MNPLDTPFEQLSFRLEDGERSYVVEVQDLCTRPLNPGVLEHCYMEPEEWRDELEDIRKKELQAISAFTKAVSAMWGRSNWALLSPTPSCDDPAFQAPERIYGRLCAAVLQSGRVLGVVPKTFLPGYQEYYEERWFSSSREARTSSPRARWRSSSPLSASPSSRCVGWGRASASARSRW